MDISLDKARLIKILLLYFFNSNPWSFESENVYDFLIRKPQLVTSLSLTASNFFVSHIDINLLTQREGWLALWKEPWHGALRFLFYYL